MDTCQFTYINNADMIRTALGVEQSWEVLCERLNRTGLGLPNGTHYLTISYEGPELFAVDKSGETIDVYYHDLGIWYRYITARDIHFGTMPDTVPGQTLVRATSPD
ncbi:unnamed protein product [Adineta ricciae]|uniref:Uncharacterized protein n=1 Tax=Adineta ricciae TaxID=249248 RepID=A0A815ADW2_ADIRI|nr:unnamed protein product [Adineta ricciae]CAF1602095.1 unnamed protein product [Adineta ricciae]